MTSGLVSPWHIMILALVLLLIFGPKRLPEMGRSIGRGMREFKDSVSGLDSGDGAPAATTTSTEAADAGETAGTPPSSTAS